MDPRLQIDATKEIRILELLPASLDSDSLRGRLIVVSLDQNPSYEALSYAWGEPILCKNIRFGEIPLAITQNLSDALRRLRYQDRPQRLWVDSTCINQRDNDEKGHQVQLMAKIYSKPSRVVVWLGVGNENTAAVIELIRKLSKTAWQYGVKSKGFDKSSISIGASGTIVKKLCNIASTVAQLPIEDFFEQQWFFRLWTLREATLAARVTFFNGAKVLELEDFAIALSVIRRFLLLLHNVCQKLDPVNLRLLQEQLIIES